MNEKFAGARVLVMEDEYFLAEDITKALLGLGLTVIGPFATRDKALNSLDLDCVDAAILDLDLAGGIDFAVADALLERRLPFVFATGYDAAAIPPRFAEIRRFEKPCDAMELARHIVDMTRESLPLPCDR
ncbi:MULTISPECIES: response regulator [unclassified Mesorhizobium]|uniref:response regulator n=1 Tax=unclassified Mesorhizobium TaxID=325217 RepID=UPI000F7534EB|nr:MULTISPECIES: response regulator [unclassified Mesorhizobium]AZO05555.1 response regulator [Mesorhizobium sp. M2A.F.Ca.ET.043.02.1.1]RUW40889.1 response regulator [Mesorhizobium sp. M2A.F.Ca.ET.015.02.1.1]RUW79164.1 response regulator [Mesorhizobium sp. M2A.F.Ca.ET.067.02.1.1]RVC98414.1 response regulator [Mesorhizobium sp. M2A.F.Ca.ET.017.03.2.1]RVD09446.1 response regulator [Mesorhizobium sp. M2A.F.Ca.ET.029.05.1.1]